MARTVIFIRHGQGVHNVSKGYHLHDPGLTEVGRRQCQHLEAELQKELPPGLEGGLIVSSPMRRTLQTALLGLRWLLEDCQVPAIVLAEWQEITVKLCDTGSSIETLSKEFAGKFNFNTVDLVFPSKYGIYNSSRAAVERRGAECRAWLRARPEEVIAVVTHGGFLRAGISYRKYGNADYRIFDILDDGALIEWEITEKRGGGMGQSPKGYFKWEEEDDLLENHVASL